MCWGKSRIYNTIKPNCLNIIETSHAQIRERAQWPACYKRERNKKHGIYVAHAILKACAEYPMPFAPIKLDHWELGQNTEIIIIIIVGFFSCCGSGSFFQPFFFYFSLDGGLFSFFFLLLGCCWFQFWFVVVFLRILIFRCR